MGEVTLKGQFKSVGRPKGVYQTDGDRSIVYLQFLPDPPDFKINIIILSMYLS